METRFPPHKIHKSVTLTIAAKILLKSDEYACGFGDHVR